MSFIYDQPPYDQPHHDHFGPHSPIQSQPQLQPNSQLSHKHSPVPNVSKPLPTRKESIARKLQRIDILLNLVYSRVTNDRSLAALLPYLSEKNAQDLVSNFTYVRHQQDNQEIKSHMTDKQLYRIFRHHYKAEQRLADTIRQLRRSASSSLAEQPPSSQLARAIDNVENGTAQTRTHHLQQVHSELDRMLLLYNTDQDFLYTHEFSQPQQITTMQSRCLAMKDEYDADDLRKGRLIGNLDAIKKPPQDSISGPEDWEHDLRDQYPAAALSNPALGHINPQWAPPDPPRSPSPEQRHSGSRRRQRRHNRRRPPAYDHNRGRRSRQDGHAIHTSSTRPGQRPGRSRRKSGTPWPPDPTGPYYSNNEFATMPNLRRRPPSRRKEFSYDDGYMPYRRGSAQYHANLESIDPFAKPYPHQSTDAFGWKPPQGILSSQYYSDFAAAHPIKPAPRPADPYVQEHSDQYAQEHADPYAQEHASGPSAYHDDASDLQTPIEERPASGKRKKWDEWRYQNGLSSGLFEDKSNGGVMHSIANMVKGRKGSNGAPHNPIEAMQLAQSDPVKFMTTMVAGEVMPQVKRKAKKIEAMLGPESSMSGLEGKVASRLTKDSKAHGQSSTHGITGQVGKKLTGQVGKKLAKMTVQSAMGGSSKSKPHGAGQLGGVLAKVAKESLKHSAKPSGGAGMINKVMNTLGTK